MTRAFGFFAIGKLAAELGTGIVCDTDLLGRVLGNPISVGGFVGTLILDGLVVVLLFTDRVSKSKFKVCDCNSDVPRARQHLML